MSNEVSNELQFNIVRYFNKRTKNSFIKSLKLLYTDINSDIYYWIF